MNDIRVYLRSVYKVFYIKLIENNVLLTLTNPYILIRSFEVINKILQPILIMAADYAGDVIVNKYVRKRRQTLYSPTF